MALAPYSTHCSLAASEGAGAQRLFKQTEPLTTFDKSGFAASAARRLAADNNLSPGGHVGHLKLGHIGVGLRNL